MLGLMQRHELLISSILMHAARHHGDAEIASQRDDGRVERTTYAALEARARQLATVLGELGVQDGDRVATLAMNSDRHLELYFAIAGIGAVCNTINPRLALADIVYIASHAEASVICVDPLFLPILAAAAPQLGGHLRIVVVLGQGGPLPDCRLPDGVRLLDYETLLQAAPPLVAWPQFDENRAAALCYTSGTTGRPKGVLYSHRSTVLNALMGLSGDTAALKATDRFLPAVPMFHVNAWGFPYTATMAGAALIFPGRHLDAAALVALANRERVTKMAGVPTIWMMILTYFRETGIGFASLRQIIVGGAAMPRALIADFQARGIRVSQAWGMTESSPIASFNSPKPACLALDDEARLDRRASQGRVVFGVDVRALDDQGEEVPWDGQTQGHLQFRGHWVASGYYRLPETSVGADGWFPTGDVGVIDPDGFIRLTDRSKDLIKSGGEWISSIAIENIAIGHPAVAEAAAIAVPHEKWGERPLLIVVPRRDQRLDAAVLRAFFKGKLPDWSIPDRIEIVDSIPHGATGKILKSELRRIYAS